MIYSLSFLLLLIFSLFFSLAKIYQFYQSFKNPDFDFIDFSPFKFTDFSFVTSILLSLSSEFFFILTIVILILKFILFYILYFFVWKLSILTFVSRVFKSFWDNSSICIILSLTSIDFVFQCELRFLYFFICHAIWDCISWPLEYDTKQMFYLSPVENIGIFILLSSLLGLGISYSLPSLTVVPKLVQF